MYKLEQFETRFTQHFATFYPLGADVSKAIFREYCYKEPKDIESCFLYDCFLRFMDQTEWREYDEMREKVNDFTDQHLHTLLKHSFYACYHRTVQEFLNSELNAHSLLLRDF